MSYIRVAAALLALLSCTSALHVLLVPAPTQPSLASFLGVASDLQGRGHCVTLASPHCTQSAAAALTSASLLIYPASELVHIQRHSPAAIRSQLHPIGLSIADALNRSLSSTSACTGRPSVALVDFDLFPAVVNIFDAHGIAVAALGTNAIDPRLSHAVDWADVLQAFDHELVEESASYVDSLFQRLVLPPKRLLARLRELWSQTTSNWSGTLIRDRQLYFPSAAGIDVPRPMPPHIQSVGVVSMISAALTNSETNISKVSTAPHSPHMLIRKWLASASARGHSIAHLSHIPLDSELAINRAVDMMATAHSSVWSMRKKPQPRPTTYRVLWRATTAEFHHLSPIISNQSMKITAIADNEWYRIDALGAAERLDTDAFVLVQIVHDLQSAPFDLSRSLLSPYAWSLTSAYAPALNIFPITIADLPHDLASIKTADSFVSPTAFVVLGSCDLHLVLDATLLGMNTLCLQAESAAEASTARLLRRSQIGLVWPPTMDSFSDVNFELNDLSADALLTARSLLLLAGSTGRVSIGIEHMAGHGTLHTVPWDWTAAAAGWKGWLQSVVFGDDLMFVWAIGWMLLFKRCCACCCCCCRRRPAATKVKQN